MRISAMQSFAMKPHGLQRARADKARAYTVARGEAAEAGAAIEIAALLGAASHDDEVRVVALASRVVAMLSRLTR